MNYAQPRFSEEVKQRQREQEEVIQRQREQEEVIQRLLQQEKVDERTKELQHVEKCHADLLKAEKELEIQRQVAKDLLAEQEKSEECLKQVEEKEARINPQIDEQHLETLREKIDQQAEIVSLLEQLVQQERQREELAKKAVLARENHALEAAEESVWQEANFLRWLEVQSCKERLERAEKYFEKEHIMIQSQEVKYLAEQQKLEQQLQQLSKAEQMSMDQRTSEMTQKIVEERKVAELGLIDIQKLRIVASEMLERAKTMVESEKHSFKLAEKALKRPKLARIFGEEMADYVLEHVELEEWGNLVLFDPFDLEAEEILLKIRENEDMKKNQLPPITGETNPQDEVTIEKENLEESTQCQDVPMVSEPEEPCNIFSARWKQEGKMFMILGALPDSETRLTLDSIHEKQLNENELIALPKKYLVDFMKMVQLDENVLKTTFKEIWEDTKRRLPAAHHERAYKALLGKANLEQVGQVVQIGTDATLHSLNLSLEEVPPHVMTSLKYAIKQLYQNAFKKKKMEDSSFLQQGFLLPYDLVKLSIDKFQSSIEDPTLRSSTKVSLILTLISRTHKLIGF